MAGHTSREVKVRHGSWVATAVMSGVCRQNGPAAIVRKSENKTMTEQSTVSQASNWNHLSDIHAVEALNDDDRACLAGIREVLERHGRLDRFGVSLLHKHFEMEPDEILVEQVDEVGRKLMIKPVNTGVVQAEMSSAYETQWHWQRSASGEVSLVCIARCFPGNYESPGHVNKHVGW